MLSECRAMLVNFHNSNTDSFRVIYLLLCFCLIYYAVSGYCDRFIALFVIVRYWMGRTAHNEGILFIMRTFLEANRLEKWKTAILVTKMSCHRYFPSGPQITERAVPKSKSTGYEIDRTGGFSPFRVDSGWWVELPKERTTIWSITDNNL